MVDNQSSPDETAKATRKRPHGQDSSGAQEPAQQPAKRSRVSRACDQCRASREKCDGAQPTCQTCAQQSRPCSYNEQPKKRGIQPNYIRTLELTLAWLFDKHPDIEHDLASQLPQGGAAPKLIAAKNPAVSEDLHGAWRNGIVCRQIDQLLSGSEVEQPDFALATSKTTDPLLLSAPVEEVLTSNAVPARAPKSSRGGSTSLKLPDNAWRLLEYYFAYTHSWLPMTNKSAVLKLMYAYPTEGLSFEGCMHGEYAELWSILALAATQLSFHDATASQAAALRDIARSLMPSEHGALELGYIKALLLLGLIDMIHSRWLPAWLLVGTSVRLITYTRSTFADLSPYGVSSSGAHTSNVSHHIVSLAAYVLESAIAIELKAPTHIQAEQVEAIGLLNEDGLEEWQPWDDPLVDSSVSRAPVRCFSSFNQLVRLASKRSAGNPDTGNPNLVSKLLFNATQPEARYRLQPTKLINDILTGSAENLVSPANRTDVPSGSTPFVSVPLGHDSSSSFDSPAMGIRAPLETLDDLWATGNTTGATLAPPSAGYGETFDAADIFEELAMLDAGETQRPDFMRNLGFAPDLDLAEFFGSDYQHSDPILAYMNDTSATMANDVLQTGPQVER